MTPKERKDLRELADKKHEGNLEAAACEFIGVGNEFKATGKVPNGNVGAVHNIVDELEKYAELDAETAESDPLQSSNTGGEGGSGNSSS